VDVSASYAFPKTSYGDFKVSIDGTYLTQFDNQLYDGSPFVSNIGQFGSGQQRHHFQLPYHHLPLEAHAKLNGLPATGTCS
jgi:iron complex outermembrane receptor protein